MIALRASCLIERADACAAGFARLGLDFAADLTRDIGQYMRADPERAALYEHWIGEQEARLKAKEIEQ